MASDLSERDGFDREFLGQQVPLPSLKGTDTVLLTYRSYSRTGSALRSSLWVLDGGQWRLRFHQGTPEA